MKERKSNFYRNKFILQFKRDDSELKIGLFILDVFQCGLKYVKEIFIFEVRFFV